MGTRITTRQTLETKRYAVADAAEMTLGDVRALINACGDMRDDAEISVAAWSTLGRFKRMDITDRRPPIEGAE
ncbi:hypothetical protein [Nocardia sp. NPDC058633]|uniref:hypothetical protein n=1 Tax=Nocardia sp. NPDC058633 TaxID=3346568 RepID=UPI003660558D